MRRTDLTTGAGLCAALLFTACGGAELPSKSAALDDASGPRLLSADEVSIEGCAIGAECAAQDGELGTGLALIREDGGWAPVLFQVDEDVAVSQVIVYFRGRSSAEPAVLQYSGGSVDSVRRFEGVDKVSFVFREIDPSAHEFALMFDNGDPEASDTNVFPTIAEVQVYAVRE